MEIGRLITTNTEERLKRYGFSEKTHYSAKDLQNNASRFKKKKKRKQRFTNPRQIMKDPNVKKKIKWNNEKKVKLVQLEEQAKNEKGFMERFKRAWDECYPESRHLTMQCLRDNAGRFKEDKTIKNLILV